MVYENAEDYRIELEARQALNEYVLVTRRNLTYQDLGYSTPEGYVPSDKVEIHAMIGRLSDEQEARDRAKRLAKQKSKGGRRGAQSHRKR